MGDSMQTGIPEEDLQRAQKVVAALQTTLQSLFQQLDLSSNLAIRFVPGDPE